LERLIAALKDDARAAEEAVRLGLPLVSDESEARLLLLTVDGALGLKETGKKAPGPVVLDVVKGRVGWRKKTGGTRGTDPLLRAVGLGRGTVSVVDATAGLLRDACALANAGLHVIALERSPILHALQRDALDRAGHIDGLTLINADARAWLMANDRVDVVYVDPMYDPDHRTAVPPKEMRALRLAVGPDEDASSLVDVALQRAMKRVVVKRPKHAPPLAPNVSVRIAGSTTRFDVYFVDGNAKKLNARNG
jgi:16S rRNA (guanine1516-N2)-methyltransferase